MAPVAHSFIPSQGTSPYWINICLSSLCSGLELLHLLEGGSRQTDCFQERDATTQSLFNSVKMFKVVSFVFLLVYTTPSVEWPMHLLCKTDRLEVNYRSCDPLQDLAFSIDTCSSEVPETLNIRIATILRYSIRKLSVEVTLGLNGGNFPFFSKELCGEDHPEFRYCGKKKGELIYYEGPVSVGFHELPQGDFDVKVELLNQDHRTIICGNFTVKSH
ncbi:lymphocyte antigen 86 [Zootoca vivipara]|uniref:lymphocyte antigen 86 n=1 Tax=Zootoca vivipara TaxID=8524 RepID=UPI00293BF254|nr:lymphocyte antigen 86 [Zootoca vivipara]